MDWRTLTNTALLVTAFVYGALFAFAGLLGFLGIGLKVLLLLSLWRYAYSVLRRLAQGRHEIPAPDMASLNPLNDIVLILHFLVFPALAILLAQTMPFGDGPLGWALVALLWLGIGAAFPASAAIMGLTSNLEAAVNPVTIAAVIRAMRRDYVALVAACLALGLLGALVQSAVLPRLGFLSSALAFMAELWSLLGIFALIGASIHQHRDDFAIPGVRASDEELQAAAREKQWRATLDLAYASIRSGLVAEGYATLKELAADHGDSLELQSWLVDRMLEWEDRRHALDVAGRLIERLIGGGDLPSAFELYQRCRRLARDFAPRPEASKPLADYARDIGQQGLADELGAGIGAQAPRPGGL